jgi:hypothetical protein
VGSEVAVTEPCVALIYFTPAARTQGRGVVELAGILGTRLVDVTIAVVVDAVTHLRRVDDARAGDQVEGIAAGRSVGPLPIGCGALHVAGIGDIVRGDGTVDAEYRLPTGPFQ